MLKKLFFTLTLLGLTACHLTNSPAQVTSSKSQDQCVTKFDPNIDYFPDKVEISYAKGFQVSYHNHYKIVTLTQTYPDALKAKRYILVKCGTPVPSEINADQIISIPVHSIIVLSTTHIPHLQKLQVLSNLIGIADLNLVYLDIVRDKVKQGSIKEVSRNGQLNLEQIVLLKPDLVTTFATGNSEFDTYPKLIELGLKVVLNAEYLENSPLGRAEWLKFTATFFNQEALANQEFSQIEERYQKIVELSSKVKLKPTVITGLNFQGTWFVSGGNSYSAQFLQDAGASYLWADDKSTGAIPLSFEAVFAKGSQADFWLPNASMWRSLGDITSSDPRYAEFSAFSNRRVFNSTRRLRDTGANDFWESGTLNPDLVLADLVKIFHPELLPDHQLFYFQKLE